MERQLVPVLRPYLTLNDGELTTYRLIRANQNNAIPDEGGYSTIQVLMSDQIGQGETGVMVFDDDLGEFIGQQYRQNINLTVRIQTFDDEAIMRANRLRTELNGMPLLDAMTEEGFSFVDVQPVVDLSAIRDTKFEERTSLDIELNIFEGSLRATEVVDPADLGKAGTPHFFDVAPIDSVRVKQYEDLEDENTLINDTPINNPPFP